MSSVLVSLSEFYEFYPEFNTEQYKDITRIAFRQAKTYITIVNSCRLRDEKRAMAIYLLTAHLSTLGFKNSQSVTTGNAGQTGIVASASVGEVSVSYQQIPVEKSAFDYWLSQTPYGLQLLV